MAVDKITEFSEEELISRIQTYYRNSQESVGREEALLRAILFSNILIYKYLKEVKPQ
jgi:hypothetical protein